MPVIDHNRRPTPIGLGARSARICLLATLLVTLGIRANWGQEPYRAAGVRTSAPGVLTFDHDRQPSRPGYYGYWDVRANRAAVYSCERGDVSLADLVEAANGTASGPSGMAHVVREGASGIRIPWPSAADQPLLPGDLVAFHGQRGDRSLDPASSGHGAPAFDDDLVAVAFIGLVSGRPILVSLHRDQASIPYIVSQLLQPPYVAGTVRVIRTDRGFGPLPAGTTPERLVDGDVLIFDRSRLDLAALDRSQAVAETSFPPAIPLDGAAPPVVNTPASGAPQDAPLGNTTGASSLPSRQAEDAVPRIDIDAGRTESDAGDLVVVPAANPETDDRTIGSLADATQDGAGRAFSDRKSHWDSTVDAQPTLSDESATVLAIEPTAAATTVVGSPDRIATEPTPTLALDEPTPALALDDLTPRPARSIPTPALASVIDPTDLVLSDPLAPTSSAHFEALTGNSMTKAADLVPTPIDPLPASRRPATSPLSATLNPFTIAIGVLTLAALCFGVSLAWSRIDRAAQSLQQPIPQQRHDVAHAPTRRQLLDRLIRNNLPLIEEQAQLPDRMDYHGEEVGRRRLMIDPPHGLAGPHFTVAAESRAADRSRAPAMSSQFSMSIDAVSGDDEGVISGADHSEVIHESPLLHRVDDAPSPADREDSPTARGSAPPRHDETKRQPESRLLERVLLAMERERRR